MKTKVCATCNKEDSVMYRIKITAKNNWIFCCKSCTEIHKTNTPYTYGGTWKGKRH